jgi:hypothetical protein
MTIRKQGSATGQVTGVDGPGGIARQATRVRPWDEADEAGLMEEDECADGAPATTWEGREPERM